MCCDVQKQYNQLWKAFQKYMQDVHPYSETLDGVQSVISGGTEEQTKQNALTIENAGVHDELESGKCSLDLHNNTFATSSFMLPNTLSTVGATRHSSFASETSEFSMQQYLPSDRYSVNTTNTNNTNNSKSRNNSIDSDTFIQQFTQGGMHAVSFSDKDKDASHDSSPYKATKTGRKPVLESIVSESALSLEESKKFSVKFKPSQHVSLSFRFLKLDEEKAVFCLCFYALFHRILYWIMAIFIFLYNQASLKNSQILPLTENEHENDEVMFLFFTKFACKHINCCFINTGERTCKCTHNDNCYKKHAEHRHDSGTSEEFGSREGKRSRAQPQTEVAPHSEEYRGVEAG